MNALLPFLANLLNAKAWGQEEEIVEAVVKLLRNSISSIRDQFLSFIPGVLELSLRTHQHSPMPCFLNLAAGVATVFGNKYPVVLEVLTTFLSLVTPATLCYPDINHRPDLLQAFLKMMIAVRFPFLPLPPYPSHLSSSFLSQFAVLATHARDRLQGT
jgi:hypothetical protein